MLRHFGKAFAISAWPLPQLRHRRRNLPKRRQRSCPRSRWCAYRPSGCNASVSIKRWLGWPDEDL